MDTQTNAYNVTLNYVCEPLGKTFSDGFMFGGDFSKSTLPLLLLQIGLANTITAILKVLLRPFVLFTFVPEMLSGIVLGPSVLSLNKKFKEKIMLPQRGTLMLSAFESIALIFLFFLLTVQVDLISILKKTRRLTFLIGVTSLLLPIAINVPIAWFLRDHMPNQDLHETVAAIAILETICTFRTVLIVLDDLKLLNSELGQTAITSSLISGTLNIFVGMLVVESRQRTNIDAQGTSLYHLSRVFLIIVIVFVLRPILLWMMRQIPEKKPLKETHICMIILMILGSALFGELTGLHLYLGPLILGMATPNSPPMGSGLLDKLGSFVWIVLMPCYAINLGKQVDVFHIGLDNFITVNFFAVLATFGRLVGAMIPPLYCKMPLKDAFPLGLILSCRGIFDLIYIYGAKQNKVISSPTFSTMVLTTVFHATIISPIFRAVYDTSRRYLVYDRRTMQHSKQHSELRVVACIHDLENVSSMINILDVTNPSTESPLVVYVINLEELVGRVIPLFISHKYNSAPSAQPTRATSIINIFRYFQDQKQGLVKVHCFTSLVSCTIMHDYICSLANEEKTTLIIIPFQKSDGRNIRGINKDVLQYAPCSVAIFFGCGRLTDSRVFNSECMIMVCVIFLGGPDDREALAYGMRMLNNPCVRLTVVRIMHENKLQVHDVNTINSFKFYALNNKHIEYKESNLVQVCDTVKLLQSVDLDFDLIVVGRRHDNGTQLIRELSKWVELEELGVIGDLLVSSNVNRASILVVQQQSLVVEEMLDAHTLH